MDPDAGADLDPAIFVSDLQDVNKKLIFSKSFFAYYFLKVHLHQFSKIKSYEEVTPTVGINIFLTYYFCLITEGSGSISLTNRSGSATPAYIPYTTFRQTAWVLF
jgi:hypothetical protein